MPKIVSQALDVSENEGAAGKLTQDDIEVRCTQRSLIDINSKDIEIVIWAHDFPSRRSNLEQRKEEILRGVRLVIIASARTDISGYVWVLLQPTAFGTL